MNNKLISGLIAGALSATLALASPALAFRGGGGGMHGGAMGGGMHFGSMGGATHFSGPSFAAPGGRFGAMNFARPGVSPRLSVSPRLGVSPRFSRFAFHNRRDFLGHRFIHHRFHRFAFIGVPFAYAAYDSCWRREWTPYGLQWVNICDYYGY